MVLTKDENDESLHAECAALILRYGADELLAELTAPRQTLIRPELEPLVSELLLSAAPTAQRLSDFRRRSSTRLSTGVSSVDTALQGGLPLCPGGMLVEVYGSAAAGKTQFCLQLCAASDVRSVYVVTAGRFPIKRFRQIAKTALDAVVVEHVSDVQEMETWASARLPWLLRKTGARLVIVDCMASLYRPAFEHGTEIERAKSLVRVAALLKEAAAAVKGVIVCVNQVSARPGAPLPVPALGPSWGKCCNTRLQIRRELGADRRRCITVMHSSFAKSGRAGFFEIGETGLTDAGTVDDA